MKIFIDTANIEEIKKINEFGIISGVTTNPSLIAKEGRDYKEVISEISDIVDVPISAEVVAESATEMIKEAEEFAKISPNVVIKIPITAEGLIAVSKLSKKGIKTNVTLVFSSAQALIASRAGATYISPFVGRLDDIAGNGVSIIDEIATIFKIHGIKTEIIAASIRGPQNVIDAAVNGAHIATIPYKVIMQMLNHPLTNSGIQKFKEDWNNAYNV